jgi:DNA processing protein
VVDPLRAGGSEERAEAEALLLLQRLPGLADRGIARLIASFGSGCAALAAPDAEFGRALDRDRVLGALRGAAPDRAAVAEALERADALETRVVPLGSAAYPPRLLQLTDPPPVLFLRGDLTLLEPPAVAVVGSRAATAYGRRTATRLAEALARSGVVVVSGLALGVDGEAHQGALAAGGGTIAVLGSGPDVAHPRAHIRLFREVIARGLIATEFAPGTLALAHHFPRRNRVMAALAHAVVVVEAAERSGALITARHALDLGRDVLAVPGPIDAPTSAGANALIKDGARPVFGADDVLDALHLPVPVAPPRRPTDGDAAAVWEALHGAPADVDEVAARSGLPARRALAALSLLELDGWAVQSGGGRFARRG